ncbi:MAG: hypothetical protein QX191_06570 [Methylococcaceae bacterium]|jgi:hypothetical protein
MPNKNDLSAIKLKNKNALQDSETNTISKTSAKAGRKPKSTTEKESETVVLKLTLQEFDHLKEKAGLVPLGTFVKFFLRNKSDLLN